MNRKLLLLILIISPAVSAECDTSIKESVDTPATIQEKMSCLTNEIASLKSELQSLRNSPKPMFIAWGGNENKLSTNAELNACRAKAISELNNRGWSASIIKGRIEGTKGSYSAFVSCKYSTLIVAGPGRPEIQDYIDILANAVFD